MQANIRRIVSILLAVMFCVACFTGCGSSNNGGSDTASVDVRNAKTIADLKGAKIAAQAGTFHADALSQIPDVQSSTYPEFADLLTALKSGAIDGYIAEEPTAFSVCASNDDLTYLPFKNNDTGFTATAADVGIAIGLKKGNTLRDQINTVLAEITDEQRSELMEQIVTLASGGTVTEFAVHCDAPATTTGTLKIGMECAYEPYNWTDTEGTSLGAVPISSEGQSGLYANGYDVQIAQYVANRLGLKLEIYAMEWDSLIPAVNSGAIDAIVAGMSPTAERSEQLDFTDTYYESNLVVIIRK
ncbi:MAG: transporter substrate-binding domain-containing protein [Oscillospiraceae bacterium]|jgi:ABC-type amino acid transport substrate-binding protein|nr:transporter substrate-binding domain-containing protein [Oscillospiraceae bacterium]